MHSCALHASKYMGPKAGVQGEKGDEKDEDNASNDQHQGIDLRSGLQEFSEYDTRHQM